MWDNIWSMDDLLTKVKSSEETEEDIRKEAVQIIYDMKWIIDLGESQWKKQEIEKKYKKVQELFFEAIENDRIITRDELNKLKQEIDGSQDNIADFYIKNMDIFQLETNKDIVLKVIDNYKNKNFSSFPLHFLNQEFRDDINIIKSTLYEWEKINKSDFWYIPMEFYKNEDNVNQLLELCDKKEKDLVLFNQSLVNWKYENQDNDKEKNIEESTNFINELNEITEHSKKIEKIESYVEKNWVYDFSDEQILDLLKIASDWWSFLDAQKFLSLLESRVDILLKYLKDNWLENLSYTSLIPINIRTTNEFQKFYIDTIVKNTNEQWYNSDIVKTILYNFDFDWDYEIAKYFYEKIKSLWEEISIKIFSDWVIRTEIKKILDLLSSNDKTALAIDWEYEIFEKMQKEFKYIKEWQEKVWEASKNNDLEQLEKQDELNKFAEQLIAEIWLDESKKSKVIKTIQEIISSSKWQENEKIFLDILNEICWWNKEKTTKFIEAVKTYELVQLNEENRELTQDSIELWINEKFKIKNEDLERKFDDFLTQEIERYKKEHNLEQIPEEKKQEIYFEAIRKFIKNNSKDWISEELKKNIRERLEWFLKRKKLNIERTLVRDYVRMMTWEISEEEYNNKLQNDFEKPHDFVWEAEIVNNFSQNYDIWSFNNYTFTDSSFVEYSWWYTIMWENWQPIESGLVISQEEKNLAIKNPEAAENLVNFYRTLNELWLKNIWPYRKEMSNVIWWTLWGFVRYEDDTLWEIEVKKFLNAILKSVWYKEINLNKTFTQFKNQFKLKNEFQQEVWEWYKNSALVRWDSKIEEIFFNLESGFIDNNWFNEQRFIKTLKSN